MEKVKTSLITKSILFLIPLFLVLGMVSFIFLITSVDIKIFTLINILVIESSFFLGGWLLNKRIFAKEFLVSLLLALIIFSFSFGGMIAQTFQHISLKGNQFTIIEILLIFFNTFWTYFRGLARVSKFVNEKSKKEAEAWREKNTNLKPK